MLSLQHALLLLAFVYVAWGRPWIYWPTTALAIGGGVFIIYIWKIKNWYKDIDPKIPRVPNEGVLGSVMNDSHKYGKIYAMRVVDHIDLYISDPDLGLEVLQKSSDKPPFVYEVLIPLIGRKSLVLVGGEEWKLQRGILQKAFHASNTPTFTEVMFNATQPVLKLLRTVGPNESIDIDHEFVFLTIRVIATAMFSRGWEGKEGELLVSKLVHIIDCMARRLREPWLRLNPFFMREFNADSTFLRSNFKEVLEEHRRTLGQRSKPDMVDVMLSEKEEGKGLTDEMIIDQCMTFFFAGHDTTAHTLAWAVHHISLRPDIEAKVIDEVDRILSTCPDGKLSSSAAAGLTYLNCVIKETLRMSPPVASFNRYASEDITAGGYLFKKGTSIGISGLAIHYNDAYYPDPHRFSPERWIDKTANHTWLPFAYWNRACIGQQFALLELRVVLAMIYSQFAFRVDTQRVVGPRSVITTVPFEGLHVYVKQRGAAVTTPASH